MVSYRVLLTCAGGPAAVGASKSLLSSVSDTRDIYVVAVDSDPYAVGLTNNFCDAAYTVPLASDTEKYWEAITDIIKKENVNLIIPTGDMDVWHFACNKDELEDLGVTVYLSDLDTIMICQNKDLFFDYCQSDFPLPTTTTNYQELLLPFFAKPVTGSGGRGAKYCQTLHDVLSLPSETRYIYQEYLPGTEYSVDTLSDLKGNVITCVVRERVQTKAGISTKGRIIRHKQIEELCTKMCKHLNLIGPSCMQLKANIQGILKFVEVNPRLGGGTYFSTLAGVNIPMLMLESLEGTVLASEPEEITVVRYFEEVVV